MSKIHEKAAKVVEILTAAEEAGLPAPREIGFTSFLDTIEVRLELAVQAGQWAKWLDFEEHADVRETHPSAGQPHRATHYSWMGEAFGTHLRLTAVLLHIKTTSRGAA